MAWYFYESAFEEEPCILIAEGVDYRMIKNNNTNDLRRMSKGLEKTCNT